MDFSSEQILLFALYTGITLIAAIVNRFYVNNNGEQIKNEAVGAMNTIAQDALIDVRTTTSNLMGEIEKRATLQGMVNKLAEDATLSKEKAEKAQVKLALQDKQITTLHNSMREMQDKMTSLQKQLDKVIAERNTLLAEKQKLEDALNERGTAYDTLMQSIQERIDRAVSDVREEMRHHYEQKLTDLKTLIEAKDQEIERLKSQIQERSHETHNQTDSTQPADPATLITTDDPRAGIDRGTGTNTDTGSSSTDSGTATDNSPDTDNPDNTGNTI